VNEPKHERPEAGLSATSLPPTIPGVLARAATRFPGTEGLVDEHERLTFVALEAAALRAARALAAAGVAPGDRVALWAPNTSRWVVAALGIYAAGAVLVPLNTRFKGAEAAYVLDRARVKLLLTTTDFLATNHVDLLRATGPVATLESIVVLHGPPAAGCVPWEAFLRAGDAVSSGEIGRRVAALDGDSVSDVMFTSGTTGKPKGALLTHGATVRAYDAWSTIVGLKHGDRYLVVNPFFHAFGLKAGIVASLLKGATIVPHAVFAVDDVLRRVAEERISMLPGPPAVYQSLLDHPRRGELDLSSLRLGVTGAATVPVELVRRIHDDLGFHTIVTGYGLTEATGVVTMCRHDDDLETIARTAGRALPGVEVRVVDDSGHELPQGVAGEVMVRGYNVMRGFFDDPAATAAAIDRDGWLRTGDVAVLDGRGNLTITDRKKDMFIVGGFNAYPAEIENLLGGHPAIAQVAVIGIPDHRLGEVGCAFVVPRAGAHLTGDDLIAWSRERIANYKVPRRVEIVAELPRNASGKVLKGELRKLAAG
jgi:acyl-CoA synthetase (AMP-forming)/AMP-acid ligase II